MAITQAESWDNTTPAGTDNPNTIDDRIQELKRTVEERALNCGITWPAGLDQDAGKLATSQQGVTGELILAHDEATAHAALLTVRGTDHASPNELQAGTLQAVVAGISSGANPSTFAGSAAFNALLNPTSAVNFGSQPVYVANDTIDETADFLVLAQPSLNAGAITLTLPAASAGRNAFFIRNIDDLLLPGSNVLTVNRAGADTINLIGGSGSGTTFQLVAGTGTAQTPQSTLLVSNGTNRWWMLFLA